MLSRASGGWSGPIVTYYDTQGSNVTDYSRSRNPWDCARIAILRCCSLAGINLFRCYFAQITTSGHRRVVLCRSTCSTNKAAGWFRSNSWSVIWTMRSRRASKRSAIIPGSLGRKIDLSRSNECIPRHWTQILLDVANINTQSSKRVVGKDWFFICY